MVCPECNGVLSGVSWRWNLRLWISPFSEVTLHLDEKWYKGAKFTIRAANQAPDHPYVQSAKLNGKPLPRAWIRHSESAAGGILEFVMGAEPNKERATVARRSATVLQFVTKRDRNLEQMFSFIWIYALLLRFSTR